MGHDNVRRVPPRPGPGIAPGADAPISPDPGEGVRDVRGPWVVTPPVYRPRRAAAGRSPSRRWRIGALLLGLLWLGLGVGLEPGGAQERGQAGGAYRRPLAADPSTLDPAR